MSVAQYIEAMPLLWILLLVGACSSSICFYVSRRQLRKIYEAGASVKKDAAQLQKDIVKMTGSPQDVVPAEEDDVDTMIEKVIEESDRKKRKLARDMAKRQKKIERELAE